MQKNQEMQMHHSTFLRACIECEAENLIFNIPFVFYISWNISIKRMCKTELYENAALCAPPPEQERDKKDPRRHEHNRAAGRRARVVAQNQPRNPRNQRDADAPEVVTPH